MDQPQQLTSTTAPGKVFQSRAELAEHYKSDWHKYNLKRREAGLPLLHEEDFRARLEAALALRQERQGREERTGTDHLKKKKQKNDKKKKKKHEKKKLLPQQVGAATTKSQVPAYDRLKQTASEDSNTSIPDDFSAETPLHSNRQQGQQLLSSPQKDEPILIEPRQCLFDKHMSKNVDANLQRMQLKYGFFVPDQEYLVDKEGLLGYCHEKIKLGHYCLYCQRVFTTWQGCQKHMISTRHTKLRYERGIDMEEFDPFYDFSEADAEFLGSLRAAKQDMDDDVVMAEQEEASEEAEEEDWEDITDDEMEDIDEEEQDDVDEEEDGFYAGYKDEVAKFGFDVTPLGELVFPDGRIIGHRGLARYYKQRLAPHRERAAVEAARRAAGERLYGGRVYQLGSTTTMSRAESSALTLARAGVSPGVASGRAGQGVLVPSSSGGFTALSLYRYKAVMKKAHRDDARGQRLKNKTQQNMNKMNKKANRLMNGVSVAHAPR